MKKLLAVALVLMTGCATFKLNDARQIMTGAFNKLTIIDNGLDRIDEEKQAEIVKKAVGGDVEGAQADLDKWLALYNKLARSVRVAWDALKTGVSTLVAIEKGLSKEDPTVVAAHVLGAVADLMKTLADAGVQIPGLMARLIFG
jgi:hypothetical protein